MKRILATSLILLLLAGCSSNKQTYPKNYNEENPVPIVDILKDEFSNSPEEQIQGDVNEPIHGTNLN